ncbi:hypothetical protein L204_105105 [Cryptococcus depauperatus]
MPNDTQKLCSVPTLPTLPTVCPSKHNAAGLHSNTTNIVDLTLSSDSEGSVIFISATPPRGPRHQTPSKRDADGSPMSSLKKRRMKFEHLEKVLQEVKVKREEENETERLKEEEEKRQIELIIKEQENEEEKEDDLHAMLAEIANISPQKSKSPYSPFQSPQQELSRTEVLRRNRQAREAEAVQKKRCRAAEAKILQEQREFDKILQYVKAGYEAEQIWREIENDNNVYPTPDTNTDVEWGFASDDEMGTDDEFGSLNALHEEGEKESNVDILDLRSRIPALAKVVGEGYEEIARDARIQEDGEELCWEGFWEKEFVLTETSQELTLELDGDNDMITMIKACLDSGDTKALSTFASSGCLILIDEKHDNVLYEWLQTCAFSSSDPLWATVASDALIYWIQNRNLSFDAASFVNHVFSILSHLHARKSILESQSSGISPLPFVIAGSREAACILICRLIYAWVSSRVGGYSQLRALVPILLLLSVDKTTSSVLRNHISDAVRAVLANYARVDLNYAHSIAHSIAKSSKSYQDDLRAAILGALGDTTGEARKVQVWLGLEYLDGEPILVKESDGSLVPSVSHMLSILRNFHEDLRPARGDNTDWNVMNFRVTYLVAVLSNIKAYFDLHPPQMDAEKNLKHLMDEHPVENIRRLLRQCRDQIADQSDGSKKILVKARLHQLYEIIRLFLDISIRLHMRTRDIGKNLKIGKSGQARLSFGQQSNKQRTSN